MPLPVASRTTSGIIGFNQATHVTSSPLLLAADAVPAVAVPCPSTSAVLLLDATKFQPEISFDAISGCVGSTPESIMAMGTAAAPVLMFQAAPALMAARCHCEVKSGLFGMAAAVMNP